MYGLKDRVYAIRSGGPRGGAVAYLMSRDQRVRDNWALIYAQEIALNHGLPLVVVFCLTPSFLGAALRHYGFMLRGLKRVAESLDALSIPFVIAPSQADKAMPEIIRRHNISYLVTDFDPLRIKKEWKERLARKIDVPFYEVDAHNIVPCRIASDKREYGAYTIRKKIAKLLPSFLNEIPEIRPHPYPSHIKTQPPDPDGILKDLPIDRGVSEIPGIIPGEDAAGQALGSFLEHLDEYEIHRNDPVRNCQSHLSPYLHFGQISAQRVALEVKKCPARASAKDAFCEELIVRRELADNYCHFTPEYDSFDALPQWAKKTLDDHRGDMRPYLYPRERLEAASTHDPLWNAAQVEMTRTGTMHGYMRMYWAKKILEWTASPEEALSIAIYLNDRYELDGRDPNGYTGIAWSIGGLHDRPWPERNIYGKIRYMIYNGCASKFNVRRYIETFKV